MVDVSTDFLFALKKKKKKKQSYAKILHLKTVIQMTRKYSEKFKT